MTVIRPNSISGVSSITGQGGDISIFRADGTAGDLTINNIVGGAATFTGVLSYEDVTNVDSVGLITARGGIRIGAGTTVGPISGIVTYFGDGSQLTGISVDSTKIETGNTKVETIDTGSDGHVKITTEGTERLRIDANGFVMIGTTTEGNSSADNLTVADSGESGITVRSGTTNGGHVYFSDATTGTEEYQGGISYQHNGNFMKFITSATEKLRISSEGYVTKPNTPAFFATHSSGSASGSIGYITYNTGGAYYNNGNHFNVNGRFTAPVTGIYHFHFHGFIHTGVTQGNIEIILRRFNSDGGGETGLTRIFDNKVNSNYGPECSLTWTGPLTASQYVQIYSYDELHHANGYFFGGYLVG